jgi:hypothetical protein
MQSLCTFTLKAHTISRLVKIEAKCCYLEELFKVLL